MGNGPKSVKWRTAVKILADEITKNRLIIFLGAGCSVTSGLPTWKELISKILDKFALKTNDTDLMRIASRLDRDFGMKFREEVCDNLRSSPIIKQELHKAIISLDINIYVTTNYDTLLEDSFRQIGYSPKIITQSNDISTLDETAKNIIKLHGDINSPSSIVISSVDYRSYESKNKAFVDFLIALLSRKTILFIGTSFDDSRLRQADDYIINLYKNKRRTPYLILKAPEKKDHNENSNYDIAVDDFKALTQDFEDRGFSVIVIENYEDIKELLNDINNQLLSDRSQKPPKNEIHSSVQQAYVDLLESNLRNLIEEKTRELCDWVRGNGVLPPPSVMLQRAKELIKHLDNPTITLSAESTFEGYLTIADTFLMSEETTAVTDARSYYEKANMALQKVSDREKWEERLLRVRAKLLFFEGKLRDAIDSIAYSKNNKTISIRLALMIDSHHYEEAYDFIVHNDPHPAWVHEALLILIFKGETQKAKDLFQKTLDEYETIRQQDKLDDSPYKDNFSYEKVCTLMAESFCNRAIRVSGKSDAPRIYTEDLTEEAKALLQESLKYIDILNKNRSHLNLNDSLFAQRAKLIEMYASTLLKNNKRADAAARSLVNIRPLRREFVEYITRRGKQFQDVLDIVISQTQEDFPDQVWAFLCIAYLEAIIKVNVDNGWSFLQKAANLADTDEEKEELASIAFEIGQIINRLDNALAIVNTVLPKDNIIRQFLEANYAYIMGNEKSSIQQLINIEKQKPKPYLVAHSLFLRANHEAKNKKWKRAKKLLDRSLNILWHPLTAERLLSVLTNIPDQDANEILKLAEKIEAYGETNVNIIYLKAQAARIVENYCKAEQYWRELIEISPDNVEYTYGLAETLFWMERYEESLDVIKELIKGDEKTNLKCLALACQIHEIKNDNNKAFDLLNNAIKNIANDPRLLLRHIELGYITGNEAASNISLQQLIDLKQQGKVPENLFSSVPSDQVIDIFRRQRLFLENLNDLYKKGQIPRSLLCEKNNIPTYLDWRVRTQNLNLLPNSEQWTDFTIYSTNGLRVSFFQKRRQLIPITVPEKSKNIVIDQHAFITLHQLGLLKKIQKRFESIYYPEVLNFIWATDQKRFVHHQLSRKKTYESLKDKLDKGLLKEMAAPNLLDEKEIINDKLLNRNMRLATFEKLILVDAYAAEEQFKNHNIKVVRLSQICEWLYSKGKLSETRYASLLNLACGELPVIDKFNLNILDDETRIIIADVTLDVMEGHGLIDDLNDSGLQVVIERWTANEIRNAVYSMQFREEVGQWQQDLANIVKESNTFKTIKSELNRAQKTSIKSPREEVDFIAWQYAAENHLPLFTDDRCLQMLRNTKYANKQFGTDALLTDMYAKKIIDLDEYASCFLKLCKWRYRFLIPDEIVLLHFAKEFNKALPGQALITIAEYGRKCMEDQGLFMGMELTEPPTPLGIKLYTIWTSRWITFLAELWQDESFNEDALMQLTKIVVRQFLPDIPSSIKPEIRANLLMIQERAIFSELFVYATGKKAPEQLHALLNMVFGLYGYSDDKRLSVIQAHLELIANNKANQEVKKFMAISALKLFNGHEWFQQKPNVHILLGPVLQEIGFNLPLRKEDEIKRPDGGQENEDFFGNRDEIRQRMPEYIPDGPLLIPPSIENQEAKVLIPHIAIRSVIKKERIDAINDILRNQYVTNHTKQVIQNNASAITNADMVAIYNGSQALITDFRYAYGLFTQMIGAVSIITNPDQALNELWESLTNPDVTTVFQDIPFILQDPFEKMAIGERAQKQITDEIFAKHNDHVDLLTYAFDWYFENMYFIPVAPPLNPWNIINLVVANPTINKQHDSSSLIYNAARNWLKSKEDDPFANLMVLDLVLNARAAAAENEITLFTEKTFYDLLDKCMNILIYSDIETTKRESMEVIQTVWSIRQLLARYFVQYLDLNDNEHINEERKVLMAWWMAGKLIHSLRELSITHIKQLEWLNFIKQKIEEKESVIGLKHFFTDQRKKYTLSRYITFRGKDLLVACVMSMLSSDIEGVSPFKGIQNPVQALDSNLRDDIIGILTLHFILGEGQIDINDTRNLQLPILWNLPICVSTPAFLRAYYADALDFLGKDKIKIIDMAEAQTHKDFLKNEVSKIPAYFSERDGGKVSIALASLSAALLTSGNMPEEAAIFQENEYLLKDISALDEAYQKASFSLTMNILDRLYASGENEWAVIIEKQFYHIDYSACSKAILELIVPGLIGIFLRSSSHKILEPIIQLKATNKIVRDSLSKIKSRLENIFPYVPQNNRESIRKILNEF